MESDQCFGCLTPRTENTSDGFTGRQLIRTSISPGPGFGTGVCDTTMLSTPKEESCTMWWVQGTGKVWRHGYRISGRTKFSTGRTDGPKEDPVAFLIVNIQADTAIKRMCPTCTAVCVSGTAMMLLPSESPVILGPQTLRQALWLLVLRLRF